MKKQPTSKKAESGNPHRGSDFSEFLAEEGLLEEVAALALKRVLALELAAIIKKQRISKTALAGRMHTSRAAVNRLLDPENPSLTLESLGKAAAALGRKVELRLVPA